MSNILKIWFDKTSILEEQVKNKYNVFSDKYLKGTIELFESDSIFVKFAFMLLAIILFYIILRLGIKLIYYIFENKSETKLVDGLISLDKNYHIPQDPNNEKSRTIHRSHNAGQGIEFTWSVWLFIESNDSTTTSTNLFYKGLENSNIYKAPGLSINNNDNIYR